MAIKLPRFAIASRDFVDQVARQSPARLALVVFFFVIMAFTALLSLPAATSSGSRASLADALFTASSAVCVTGLTTVTTATYWSTFGQVVILIAIKIGGLGIMTLASILGLAVSRRIGLTQRLLVASETKFTRLGEVGSLVRVVIMTSTAVEVAISVLLFPRFLMLGQSVGESAWHAVFMGISSFNNAGFVVMADGLTPYVGDWWICMPLIIGTILGSLGFPVILNIMRQLKHPRTWTLHAKLTVTMTIALLLLGWVAIGAFEWNNPQTLGALPLGDRILAALFAGTMPRSSGLSTVDISAMHEGTWLITDALMFVGGGPASTAGGIKVTTLAIMILAIRAEARGDRDTEVFGRRIPPSSLRLAVTATFVGATMVLVGSLLLLAMTPDKGWALDVVLFETISAFATCGLSTGITPDLPEAAKFMFAGLMFLGRTGTMTLAAALALRERRRVIRYPEERPIIG